MSFLKKSVTNNNLVHGYSKKKIITVEEMNEFWEMPTWMKPQVLVMEVLGKTWSAFSAHSFPVTVENHESRIKDKNHICQL